MKRFLALAAVAALSIALFAVAGRLRKDSFAETPGAVVEEFLRHVDRERYEKATPLLSAELEQEVTSEELGQWDREVRAGMGDVRRFHGETEWISGEKAEATGVLESARRERRLRFGLKREGKRWEIDRLDEFWGATGASIPVFEKWRERTRPVRARRPAPR